VEKIRLAIEAKQRLAKWATQCFLMAVTLSQRQLIACLLDKCGFGVSGKEFDFALNCQTKKLKCKFEKETDLWLVGGGGAISS
jgi:hypothetical protein